MLGGSTDERRILPIIYFLVIRIAVFIYNTPFIQYIINLPKKILNLFKPITKIFSTLFKPFQTIWKTIKKPFEPIMKPFQRIWQIIKYIIFAPYYIFNFFYTNFKIFMLDLWEIIKMAHNLYEMYTITNAILYTLTINPKSESVIKRFIYLGTMLVSLIVIGYNKYNDIIINPIFGVIEQLFFGKSVFSKKKDLSQAKKTNTILEFFNKYMFAIFPISITLILMKLLDCGVISGKDKIPYIPIPIPFVGPFITPILNKLLRMADIEFFYCYVAIRFLVYFIFQLPVRLMLFSDKVTQSINKLGPIPKQILKIVKIIYYILNPIGFVISRIVTKNNYKVWGSFGSSVLSIVSMVVLGLYFKGHSSVAFLSKIENNICNGIDLYNSGKNIINNPNDIIDKAADIIDDDIIDNAEDFIDDNMVDNAEDFIDE